LVAVIIFSCPIFLEGSLVALGLPPQDGDLDLLRFCAAPLIIHCAAKEMNDGHRQDG
jgi:hypothetical protein